MIQNAVFNDYLIAAAGRLAQEDPLGAMEQARRGLDSEPDDPGLLMVLIRAAMALGDHETSDSVGSRLQALAPTEDIAETLVDLALAQGDLQAARTAQAIAEAEQTLPPWKTARIKARIALADGDTMAAKAILVMAIEAHPDATALRMLLAETLVGSGSAGHARDVLQHLGKPPVNPTGPSHSVAGTGTESAYA